MGDPMELLYFRTPEGAEVLVLRDPGGGDSREAYGLEDWELTVVANLDVLEGSESDLPEGDGFVIQENWMPR